jgi:hypothetical protein
MQALPDKERIDALEKKMDDGFREVRKEMRENFREVRGEIGALSRTIMTMRLTMILGFAGIILGFAGVLLQHHL